jgi:outer membrane immunogenic protein
MKKFTFIILFLSLIGYNVNAQNGTAPLARGQKQLNFGTGFSDHGLPLYVSLDFAVHKDVTITPQVNIAFKENNTSFGLLVKGDYHWNYLLDIPSDWDFYAGARLGFTFGNDSGVNLGLQVGGRWYFTPKWALNLELAGGTGYGTALGVSYKL